MTSSSGPARYRDAVDDWNDNLNRMLALAQRYFGQGTRDTLDYGLMMRFVQAGRRLERRVRAYGAEEEPSPPPVEDELDSLANEVYLLNVRLIEEIQHGTVGVFHPDVDTGTRQGRAATP